MAPFYYKLSPDNVYAYFKEIGRNTPVDVTLYNIPMFASPIDVPTIQRLSEECERIVAIKDSSGDVPHMMRMIARVRPKRPDFSFLTGWDAALMPMLLIGCDGGTNATAGVIHIITKKGTGEPSVFGSVEGGSYNTWKATAGASGAFTPSTRCCASADCRPTRSRPNSITTRRASSVTSYAG